MTRTPRTDPEITAELEELKVEWHQVNKAARSITGRGLIPITEMEQGQLMTLAHSQSLSHTRTTEQLERLIHQGDFDHCQ